MSRSRSSRGKVVAIIQARMSSTRLPGKVMADVAGRPMIDRVLARARRAETLDAVWVATSESAENDELARHVEGLEVPVFRGDEDDVLSRYVGAARASEADVVVRLTADCPLMDPGVIDQAVTLFFEGQWDYLSNTRRRTYPYGLDVEVFRRGALERAAKEARHPRLREHVTLFINGRYQDLPHGEFQLGDLTHRTDYSDLRWTVDWPEDLEFVRRVIPQLPADFGWLDVVALCTRQPELLGINQGRRVYGSPA